MIEGALAGLTVLEVPDSVAIRYCGKLFAYHGARVLQAATPSAAGVGYGGRASTAFAEWLDHGKHPLTDAPTAGIDIVVAAKPKAAGVSGTLQLALNWFDQRGPYREWQGSDALIQALSGVAFAVGPIEGPPLLPRGHAPQLVGGATGFIAAMAGLIGRADGWAGQRIDADILSANLCFAEAQVAGAALTGDKTVRRGINRYTVYPSGVYPAADGWIGVTALTPSQWTSLCDLADLPELGHAPRYQLMTNRFADKSILEPQLRAAFARRPALFWVEEGQRRRIPMAPMPDLAALPKVPHWQERRSFAPVPGVPQATGPTMPFRIHYPGPEQAPRERSAAQAALPLQGINVLDLSMGWAGPLAARHFADLGADVVKVESCQYFDWWRGWDGDMTADPPPYETRGSFLMVNRNKRAMTLDFKTEEGRALVRRLAAQSDVLIENHAPGVLDKLGIGAMGLAEANPGLIAISMGAFGSRGPWHGFRAYGSTVEQASGLPFVNGRAEDPPTMQHVAYGDPVGGLYGAVACLIALYANRRRRRSAWIDLGQVECLFQLAADAVIAQSLRPDPLPREGSAHPAAILRTCVPTAGGDEWLAVSIETMEQQAALARVVGAAGDGVASALAAWSATRRAEAAAGDLQSAGVPAAMVRAAHDLPNDPQLRQSGFWQRLERPFVGSHVVPLAPYRLDGAAPPLVRPAPTLGQHNHDVLVNRIGLRTDDLARLERAGVIGTRPTVAAAG